MITCTALLTAIMLVAVSTSSTAYYETNNYPDRGYRGVPPQEAWTLEPWGWDVNGNRDADIIVDAIDNLNTISAIPFSGGPQLQPELMMMPFQGGYVWYISFEITAIWTNPGIDEVRSEVITNMLMKRNGVWDHICTEQETVSADSTIPFDQESGWLYLYDDENTPQHGDQICIEIYSQAKYKDNQGWHTTSQYLGLHYFYSIWIPLA